ncbi:MAG: hypothetical protein DWQ04_15995 [Chloroflexi bacterium]|nr:MAG: hypothetical protein DWQ04_15995 [Chloroflexota bacterium]
MNLVKADHRKGLSSDIDSPPRQSLGAIILTAITAAGISEHTRRSYQTSLGQFFAFLGETLELDFPLAEPEPDGRRILWAFRGDATILHHITPAHLDGFRTWLQATGAGINTQETRLSAVITFLSVCYRDGYLADIQAHRMGIKPYKRRRRRDHTPTGRRLSKNEVKQLRRSVSVKKLKGKRDRAVLDLMLYAGLREAEVCALTFDNIHQSDGRFWLKIHGKGHKTRRIKIHDTLYSSLQNWLQAQQEAAQKPNEVVTAVSFPFTSPQSSSLFSGLTRHSKLTQRPLTTATVRRVVAEYGRFANLAPLSGPNRLSPHDLRRTCARNAYDNGAPIPKIQKMLGHASIETTMRYIGSDDDETETAVDFVHY